MRKTLRALLFMLVVSLVLCAFAACDTTAEKTKLETPTVAAKVYTGSKLTATIAESEGYTVVTNEGGTDVGEYDVVLKLSDETKYEWAKPDADDATRVTLKFAVTKATNEITALALDGWVFGETANTPTVAAKFGTPTFTYGATADGEFSETVPTAAGNYFVKATVAATANYDGAEKTAEFKIAHSNATLTNMPVAVANLVYTGSAQELVTAGVADGGTMQYKLGTDGTWSSDIPTVTNAGEYTVYYKVLGDDNHGDIAEASVTVVMAKANSTFSKLPSDPDLHYTGEMQALLIAGETTCGTIWYKLDDGEWTTTIPTEINAVGHNVYYKIVGDDNHNDLVDDETQKLYVTIARANALVTAPTAKTGLTYSGENQPLVNAGSATGATINYKLGDGEYSETIPAATNAGEYTVYYKFTADNNYTTIETEQQLTVTVAKAAAQVTAPTAKTDLTYNGEAQTLVNAGSADGATIEYKLGDGEYTSELPSATNAGEYKVYYKFTAEDNYTVDETESQLTVTIAKAQDGIDFSIEGVEVHCGESVPELTATSTSGNTVTFTYSLDGTNFVSKSVLEESGFAFEDGKTYYVKASVAESDNYLAATVTKSITATHKFETTESNGITTVACACGTKNVSGTLATKQTIDLDATVADGNVSAKGGVLDLTAIGFDGNSMVDLTIGETALRFAIATDGIVALDGVLPLGIYGEQSINVGFTYGKASYNVTINALVVTKTIKTADDYANWITIAKACETEEKLWGGYFRLGNDISATNMVVFTRGETNGTEGFKGVFDGCGYAIDGLTRTTWNSDAFVTTMTAEGVLKNIAFTAVRIVGEGNFLCSGGKGTIENVFVQYAAISQGDVDGNNATIVNMQEGCALRNIFVDASNAVISGNGANFRILTKNVASGFGGVFGVCPSENYTPSQAIGDRGNNYSAIAYFASFAELKAKTETKSVLSAWNDNGFWIVKDGVPMPKNLTVTALNLGAKDIDLDVMVDGDNVSLNDGAVTFDCFAIGFDFAQAVSLTMDGNNVEFVEGDVTVSGGVLSIKRSIFGFAYGEKNIVITDVDGKTITVSATLVTKTLMNATDYSNWIKIANACEAENQILGGYFKLGANITSETMVTFERYDVYGKYGFKGVFDGCGYAIDGLTATGNAFISCMTKDGVLRNIAFTNAKIAGESNFLCSGGLGTIENVYVQYVSIAAGSNNNGTIFNNCRDEKNVVGVIKNVFVDASNAVISGTGSSFRLIGGNNNGYNGIFAVCPEGYTVTQARDTGSFADAEHAVCAFASFDELKKNTTTQNTLKGWDSTYWTIVDGVPTFVTK